MRWMWFVAYVPGTLASSTLEMKFLNNIVHKPSEMRYKIDLKVSIQKCTSTCTSTTRFFALWWCAYELAARRALSCGTGAQLWSLQYKSAHLLVQQDFSHSGGARTSSLRGGLSVAERVLSCGLADNVTLFCVRVLRAASLEALVAHAAAATLEPKDLPPCLQQPQRQTRDEKAAPARACVRHCACTRVCLLE
jgi:hypothetical protein